MAADRSGGAACLVLGRPSQTFVWAWRVPICCISRWRSTAVRRMVHRGAQSQCKAAALPPAVRQEAPATSRRSWTLIASAQAPLLLIAKSAGSERRLRVGSGPKLARMQAGHPLQPSEEALAVSGCVWHARQGSLAALASLRRRRPASSPSRQAPAVQHQRPARPAAGTHLHIDRPKRACVSGRSACSAGCAALYAGSLAGAVLAAGTVPVAPSLSAALPPPTPASAGLLRC